jgi:putative endonuclease
MFYYVYFLKSLSSSFRYVGYTYNLRKRLDEHNNGLNKSAKPFIPFEIDAYIAVKTEKQAKDLERYFKSGSGIAFARKRILTYEALAK